MIDFSKVKTTAYLTQRTEFWKEFISGGCMIDTPCHGDLYPTLCVCQKQSNLSDVRVPGHSFEFVTEKSSLLLMLKSSMNTRWGYAPPGIILYAVTKDQ